MLAEWQRDTQADLGSGTTALRRAKRHIPRSQERRVPKEACLQAVISQDAFSEGTGGALESGGWGEVKVNADCRLGSTQSC